jgi:hypothetical protein
MSHSVGMGPATSVRGCSTRFGHMTHFAILTSEGSSYGSKALVCGLAFHNFTITFLSHLAL